VDLEYRLRVRNAANSADLITITSTRGGTNPYLTSTPTGDALTVDPRKAESFLGVYSIRFADPDIGSMQRLFTSQLNDTNGRPQLGFLNAFIEYRVNGGSWLVQIAGIIVRYRLVSGIEWEVSVGDPQHAGLVTQMFSPSSATLISDFLSAWPLRGCLLGGPIMGANAFGITDLGGWQMRVEATAITGEYYLRPVRIYGPPDWHAGLKGQLELEAYGQAINEAASAVQIPLSDGSASSWSTVEDSESHGWAWRGLTVLIDGVAWKPLAPDYDRYVDSNGFVVQSPRLMNYGYHGNDGLKVKSDGVKTLTDGALVRVRALTVLPSEISPLYLIDHPVELLKTFWTSVGRSYDSMAATALKELIGTDARFAMRITSAVQLSELEQRICFAWGIGLRGNDAGEIQVFDARLGRATTTPAATITSADVLVGTVRPYDLDTSQAVKSIAFTAKRFTDQRMISSDRKRIIVDGVSVSDLELTVVDDAPGALPYGDMEMSFDGMIMGGSVNYPTVLDFFLSIARRFFDRWGWGGVGASMTLLRGGAGDSVREGDEILVDLDEIPNQNYRLGDNPSIAARAFQIVHRNIVAEGYEVELVDSGLTGQPPGTLPTVTIAASSDLPRTIAEVTVANAATLNAAGYGATVQIAFGATSTRYTDVLSWAPGKIPTGAVRLPPVVAGTAVYVRARSEQPGHRPSNWGTPANLTLTGITAPSAFTATPVGGDGSRCALAWTNGSATDLVDIWIRLDGEAFSAAVRVDTLPPGSNRYDLAGLVPSTNYIASVQHRDPRTADVSTPTDASFTTSGTAVTLNPPTSPSPFAAAPSFNRLFGQNTLNAGLYGIAVAAAQIPGQLEIAEAVETGVGAGTYGSYSTVGRISAVSGNWTLWQNVAPNDGLRRKLKARSVRDGTTASSYCAEVIATPWTYQALPAYPGDALVGLTAVVTALYVSAVDYALNEVTVSWVYSGDLGTGTFELWRIVTAGATADLSGSQSNRGTTSGASPASIVDSVPDDIISTAGPKVTYSYQVRVLDGSGTLLRATEWMSVTYSHA
jgi:hypothetical protein